jgi:Skp family chaperone for outer membrane proteins
MKSMLTALIGVLIGSILSLAVVGHAQSSKTPSALAFVSANRILNETAHGRSQLGRIQGAQQRANTDLRNKQQALETTRQQLAAATDNAAKLTLQQKEQQQRSELERATQQAQTDLQNMQREINTDLQQRLKATLDDLMKTQGYQVVMNSDTNLFWSAPELDLTSAVVGRMNGQQ